MALKLIPPLLAAVDTNVALDFADRSDDVLDSVAIIRERIGDDALCAPPTVVLELAHAAGFGEVAAKRRAATQFLRQHRSWRFRLINSIPASERQAIQIAEHLRNLGLIPAHEINDSLVLAESALLGCSMLLTSDQHLRSVDFERLAFELRSFEISPPVIATPREIVRKFFR